MLSGTLASFTLPDIFQLLSHTRKSGRLTLTDGDHQGGVWFVDGQVRYATSTSGRLALGRRLVGSGLLADGDLEQALARQQELREEGTGLRIGELLVEDGAIDRDTLVAHVREQITDAVFDLMRWSQGAFAFDPDGADALAEQETILLELSVENLVMEGSRRLEEWSQVERLVPSTDAVVTLAAAPDDETVEVALTRAEWRLVTLIDGQRTVGDLVELVGQGQFHTAKILHGLVASGLVRVVTPDGRTSPAVAGLLRQQELLSLLDGPEDLLAAALAGEPTPQAPAPDAAPAITVEPTTPEPATAEPTAVEADVVEPEVHVAALAEPQDDASAAADDDLDTDLVERLIAGVKNL